ncbi:MAG: DUF6268 family outer membrane beta-barrel protein [Bacteroidota bacterium]
MSLLFFMAPLKAQTEIARMDYSVITDLGGNTVSDLDASFRQQLWQGKHNVSLKAEYQNREFTFFDGLNLNSLSNLNRIHTLGLSLDYEKKLGSAYSVRVILNPVLSTTWGQSLTRDDFYGLFETTVSKTWQRTNKSQTLSIGVFRNVAFGAPQILPSIAFDMTWENGWFVRVGFPESLFGLAWDERNSITLGSAFDGSYSHISSSWFQNGQPVDSASFLLLNGKELGLEYIYRLQPNFTTTLSTGYQFVDEFEITDTDETTLYDFGSDSSIYFSIGIQYNFK